MVAARQAMFLRHEASKTVRGVVRIENMQARFKVVATYSKSYAQDMVAEEKRSSARSDRLVAA